MNQHKKQVLISFQNIQCNISRYQYFPFDIQNHCLDNVEPNSTNKRKCASLFPAVISIHCFHNITKFFITNHAVLLRILIACMELQTCSPIKPGCKKLFRFLKTTRALMHCVIIGSDDMGSYRTSCGAFKFVPS